MVHVSTVLYCQNNQGLQPGVLNAVTGPVGPYFNYFWINLDFFH